MNEQIIHGILLALHNIALVGCAAAPFYNRQLVNQRIKYGPRLYYEMDKVVENTIQGNTPYCIVFIITLVLTGIGMPLNHYLFHGSVKDLSIVAATALWLKLASVFGMVVVMMIIFLRINPRLRELFAGFTPEDAPNADSEKRFFALRALRKQLCEICLKFAVGILVFSAFIGFPA